MINKHSRQQGENQLKRYKTNCVTTPIAVIGLAIIFDALWNIAAFGATLAPIYPIQPIKFDVTIKNDIVGNVQIRFDQEPAYGQYVIGGFEVTAKDNSGTAMTIDQVQNKYGLKQLNWLQIVTLDPSPPKDYNRRQLSVPFIDPPNGGYENLRADDKPWFWDDAEQYKYSRPPISTASLLGFIDTPINPVFKPINFVTFLIGDFGDMTYDTLGGFSWSVTTGATLGLDGRPVPNTVVTSLKPGATFTADYAQLAQRDFGYTKVLKLPTYTFDGSLTPGKVNSFTKSDLPANAPFLTWTDNLPGINPPKKPDTVLRTLDGTGKVQRNYNDNGGPFGPNKASGLDSSVNLAPGKGGSFFLPTNNGTITENKDGIINLEVTGSADLNFNGLKDGTCDPQPEQGNYKLFVKLYENSFYPGGGVFTTPNIPLANTDCVKTEIITIPPNLPPIFPPCNGGSGGSGCSTTSLLANRYSRPSSVPEPTAALGLLALGTWGAVQGLKIRKSKRQ